MASTTTNLGLTKPAYSDDADISDINGNMDLIDAEAGRIRANVAANYDSSETYAVGDYCLHDGSLYKCSTTISSPEAWTAGHWTQIKITGELSALNGKTIIRPTSVSGVTIENISTIIKAANIVCANISIKFAAGTSISYLGEIASGFPVPYSPIYVHAAILETGVSFNMRMQSTGKLVSSQEMSFTSTTTVMVSFAYVSA